MDRTDISLVCPANDLESVTILEIAAQYHLDIRKSRQGLGGTLGQEPAATTKNLKSTVMIVELPDIQEEQRLEAAGKEVIIIDHHRYEDIDRQKSVSSLEQFCQYIGHTMTRYERAVAINDRDFISGLSQQGYYYTEMSRFRKQEREIKSDERLFNEVRISLANETNGIKRRRFSDIDIILSPEKYLSVLGEAAQWPETDDEIDEYNNAAKNRQPFKAKQCLTLFCEEHNSENIVQVEYYGPSEVRDSMNKIIEDNDSCVTNLRMWAGGGKHTCFWCAQVINRAEGLKQTRLHLDKLIDSILSFTLIEGRPLRCFGTDFLFPFRWKDNGEYTPDWNPASIPREPEKPGKLSQRESEDLQEVLYFLPYLRELMYEFEGDKDRLEKECCVDTVHKWILQENDEDESYYLDVENFPIQTKDKKKVVYPVRQIALYRFFNNVYMLGISTGLDPGAGIWDGKPFWKALLDECHNPENPVPFLDDALAFNNLARIVYQSFSAQRDEGKVADIRWLKRVGGKETTLKEFTHKINGIESIFDAKSPPVSPIITEMLKQFFPGIQDIENNIEVMIDDRMFTHTCIALAGDKPSNKYGEDRYHAAFSLALYIDKFSDIITDSQGGYYYDKDFTKNLLKDQINTRWYGVSGNLYGFTRYSSVYMAFGYFFHTVVSTHVRTMYLRLSLFALFYRTSLLFYSRKISELNQPKSLLCNKKEMDAYSRDIQKIIWEFIRFANKHWFREITAQEQGLELFNLQCKAMDIEKEYTNIRSDIERTHQYLDMKYQSNFSKWSKGITWAAFMFTIAALVTGFFGMNFQQIVDEGSIVNELSIFWTAVGGIGVLCALGLVLYKWKKR